MSQKILDPAAEMIANQCNIQAIENAKALDKSSQSNISPTDTLLLVIMSIMDAVNIGQERANLQAKQLCVNANAQMSLNNQAQGIAIVAITENEAYQIKTVKIKHSNQTMGDRGFVNHHVWYTTQKQKIAQPNAVEQIQTQNQKNESLRDGISNQVLLLRQIAQVGESQINSTMDTDQQSVSMAAGILQLLITITNQVTQR